MLESQKVPVHRPAFGDSQNDVFLLEKLAFEQRFRKAAVFDHQINHPVQEHLFQMPFPALHHIDFHIGEPLLIPGDQGRKQIGRDHSSAANGQAPGFQVLAVCEIVGEILLNGQNLFHRVQVFLPHIGELDGGGAVNKRRANLVLHPLDAVAQSRLGDIQFFCRAGKAPLFPDRIDIFHSTKHSVSLPGDVPIPTLVYGVL